jgi:hypothetical protein
VFKSLCNVGALGLDGWRGTYNSLEKWENVLPDGWRGVPEVLLWEIGGWWIKAMGGCNNITSPF